MMDYFGTRNVTSAHPNFTSGPIGVQKNCEIFFFEMKKISQKICFLKILKIFEKSQNSIGISMIPFITRYKGNHRNPYRFFRKIFEIEKFPKSLHPDQDFSKTKQYFSFGSSLQPKYIPPPQKTPTLTTRECPKLLRRNFDFITPLMHVLKYIHSHSSNI